MRIDDVSYDEVARAAEALVGGGGTASVRRIRKALDGGSHGTISRFLRLWREQKEHLNAATIERAGLPEAILVEVHNTAVTLWKAARSVTQGELDALTQSHGHKISVVTNERDNALRDLEESDEELKSATARITELESAADKAAAFTAEQRQQIEQLKEQLRAVEWRASIAEAEAATMKQQGERRSKEFKLILKQLGQLGSPLSTAPSS